MNLIQNKGTCQNIIFSLRMGVYHVGLHHIWKICHVLIIDVKNTFPVRVPVAQWLSIALAAQKVMGSIPREHILIKICIS